MSLGKNSKAGFDYGKASERGDFEWDAKCKRVPANPNNGSFDGGKSRHPVEHDPDWYAYDTGKPGPLPRK